MKQIEIIFGVLRVPIDFVMIMAALLLAYTIRPHTDLIPWVQVYYDPADLPLFSYYLQFALICTLSILILNALLGLYKLKTNYHLLTEFVRIVVAVSLWLMGVIAFYVLIIHDLPFSRVILLHSWLFAIAYIFLGRCIVRMIQYACLYFGYGRRNLLFLGIDNAIDQLYQELKYDSRYTIFGALSSSMSSRKKGMLKIVGDLNDFRAFILNRHIDDVICCESALKPAQIEAISAFCQTEHIGYQCVPDLKQSNFSLMEIDLVSGIPLISFRLTPLLGWGKVAKRMLDIVGALLGLLLLSPILLFLAICIKVDSRGPVFFISRRVGGVRSGTFPMVKFRSMVVDADKQKEKFRKHSHRTGPLFKIKNDPRVTRLGRFLRKTSMDELPQLFNVLLGHMSLVGPRPHLPEEVAKYEDHHKIVLGIKPGITGLAQISGRSDLDFEEEVRLDRFYIEHWSILFDMEILFRTVVVIVRGKGAD